MSPLESSTAESSSCQGESCSTSVGEHHKQKGELCHCPECEKARAMIKQTSALTATFGLGLALGALGATLFRSFAPSRPETQSAWLNELKDRLPDSIKENIKQYFSRS